MLFIATEPKNISFLHMNVKKNGAKHIQGLGVDLYLIAAIIELLKTHLVKKLELQYLTIDLQKKLL